MRVQTPAWLVGGFALLFGLGGAAGQGTFQNLGFESASLVPIPGDSFGRVQFATAFPGWTGLVGGEQQTAALYNSWALDTSAISIIGPGWPAGNPLGGGGVIQGTFTAILQAGVAPGPSGTLANTTLSQTVMVPTDAQSLRFAAYAPGFLSPFVPLRVILGGQQLSLVPVASRVNYTVYDADIHEFAGLTEKLDFTVPAQDPHVNNNYVFLDAIQFLNQPIPEPSVFGLSTLGALFLGWRALRRRR